MSELPLVSFCLFTYNQEKYIVEAIDGAFSQDYDNLEIIISDDCSTDSTWEIVNKKAKQYSGKHKVVLNRNEHNLGVAAHVNKLYYDLSNGKYVAVAAGDDISLPPRISKSVEFLEKNSKVVALSTSMKVIYENSNLDMIQRQDTNEYEIFDIDYYLSTNYKHINGASRIVKRSLIEAFPPLNKDSPTEDTTMLLRAFMFGKVALIKEKLVHYRLHDNNLSSAESLRKMKLENIFRQNFLDKKFAKEHNYLDVKTIRRLRFKLIDLKIKKLIVAPLKNVFQRIKRQIWCVIY